MAAAAPIGREREFEALLAAARDAAAGRGSIVFLAGATGSGKSFLLKALVMRSRPTGPAGRSSPSAVTGRAPATRSARSATSCAR